MTIREKVGWTVVCALALTAAAALAGVIGAGPLDPPGTPAPTDGVLRAGTPITALPATISVPGKYYLTRNLTKMASGDGITISASDVDLDLGGFTLTGPDLSAGIFISGTRVRVHNGYIVDWDTGIAGVSSTAVITVEGVHVTSVVKTGVSLLGSGVVRDCSVNSASRGVTVGNASLIEGCRVHGASIHGIVLGVGSVISDCAVVGGNVGLLIQDGSIVKDCVVNNNTSIGIEIAQGAQIIDTVVDGNGATGIKAGSQAVVITGCSVRGTTPFGVLPGVGIEASVGVIDGCVIEGNVGGGIAATGFFIVRNSIVGDNGGIGISVGESSLVEGNSVADNAGDGIRVTTGSRVLNNTLRFNSNGANAAGVHLTGEGNWVEGSDLSSNDIGIKSDVGNNTILNNTARNHTFGHFAFQADDLVGVTVTDANDGTNTTPHFNNTP